MISGLNQLGELDWQEKMTKFEITMIVLLAIAFVWFMWVVTITIRFLAIFKWRKPLFTSFLILINLSLLGRLVFLSYTVVVHWPGDWENKYQFWADGFISYIGNLFLSIAGIVNLANWIYFIISVKTIIPAQKLTKKRIRTIVNWSIIPLIIASVLLYSIGLTWGWMIESQELSHEEGRHRYKYVQRYMFIMTSWVFFILAIGFLVAGKWLRNELKAFNEDLELSLRGKLIYASWILSIPFMIRVIYNVIGAIIHIDDRVMRVSIDNDTIVAPLVYFWYIMVADLLPIASQLISMLVVVDDVNANKAYDTQDDISDLSESSISILDEKENERKGSTQFSGLGWTSKSTPPSNYRYLSAKFLTNSSASRDEKAF